jgi:hypothetical protein
VKIVAAWATSFRGPISGADRLTVGSTYFNDSRSEYEHAGWLTHWLGLGPAQVLLARSIPRSGTSILLESLPNRVYHVEPETTMAGPELALQAQVSGLPLAPPGIGPADLFSPPEPDRYLLKEGRNR